MCGGTHEHEWVMSHASFVSTFIWAALSPSLALSLSHTHDSRHTYPWDMCSGTHKWCTHEHEWVMSWLTSHASFVCGHVMTHSGDMCGGTHEHEWVMSRIQMMHDLYVHESHEWVMYTSHASWLGTWLIHESRHESRHTCPHTNDAWLIHEWVMSRILEWVMSCIHEWVMSRIQMMHDFVCSWVPPHIGFT